jgi:diguanylate cyclase (GGDEF)-like protein
MNNHGIRARILLLALLPLALVAMVLSWYSIQARQSDIEQALEERALAVARELAQACEYGLFAGQHDVLLRQARLSQSSVGASAVSIVDANGRELLRLGQPRFVPLRRISEASILASDDESLQVAAPVLQAALDMDSGMAARDKASLLGFVALELPRRATIARQRQVLLTSLAFTALGLALAGLLAWRLGRDVVRPISRLAEAVERIGSGDLNARVDVDAGGEFLVLERGINRMAAELQASYGDLQEKIRAATEELAWRADHDPLTGLLNRSGFDAALGVALEQARAGRRYALLYLDLDRFKQVNDAGGHLAGDELLRQFATLVRSRLNDDDGFARLGGDEFAILMADCDPSGAEQRAWALSREIGDFQFHCAGSDYQVGASIGLVSLNQDWADTETLLHTVDCACYAAKHGGCERVRVHPPAGKA